MRTGAFFYSMPRGACPDLSGGIIVVTLDAITK